MSRSTILFLTAALTAFGCTPSGSSAPWPEDFSVGFLLTYENEQLLRIEGPIDSSAPRPFAVQAGTDLHLIVLSVDALKERDDRLLETRPDFALAPESEALRAEPGCSLWGHGYFRTTSSQPRVERSIEALDEPTRSYRLESLATPPAFAPTTEVPRNLALSYNVLPCDAGRRWVSEPFVGPDFFGASEPVQFRTLRYLDADTILASHKGRLSVVERGSSTISRSVSLKHMLPPEAQAREKYEITWFDLVEMGPDAWRGFVILRGINDAPSERDDHILVVHIDSSTITRVAHPFSGPAESELELRRIAGARDAAGGFVAIGRNRIVSALGDRAPSEWILEDVREKDIAWTGDPETPFVLTGKGGIWLGDPRQGRNALVFDTPVNQAVNWERVAAVKEADKLIIYASANSSVLYRRVDGVWGIDPIWLEADALACAGTSRSCGRVEAGMGPLEVSAMQFLVGADQTHLGVALAACSALFLVTKDRDCALSLPVDGPTIRRIDKVDQPGDDDFRMEASARWGDRVLFGGARQILDEAWLETE